MPATVDKLSDVELKVEKKLRERFTEEQMCAYFLTKTIRSQYQFDDVFIADWYEEIFGKKPELITNARCELVQAYTTMLMFEKKYQNHLHYWIRQYQENIINEMDRFFDGEPGK